MTKKIKLSDFVCSNCGSNEIETKLWVDVNTNKIIAGSGTGYEDNWCKSCETHPTFITKKEFLENES